MVSGVEVTVSEDKRAKLASTTLAFLLSSKVDRSALRDYAGLVSWVASIVPALKPFVAVI